MTESYWLALAGGALIGVAATLLLAVKGEIAGISGIAGRLIAGVPRRDRAWRVAFLGGLIAAGALVAILAPGWVRASPVTWTPGLILAGLLVGAGTQLGNGCTSGHGVCGLSRLSGRSLVATFAFMASGVGAATLVARALGPLFLGGN